MTRPWIPIRAVMLSPFRLHSRAVRVIDARFVQQPDSVADACVLVHDHPVEHDVASDSEPRPIAPRGRRIVDFIVVGAEQH